MEKRILRLLIIDGSPDDAELAATALRKGGYMLKSQLVQNLAGVQTALQNGRWDAVISEHTLPHFSAQAALEALKQAGLDIPFIVFTHRIKDDDLVKIMNAGVHDVLLKSQTARLVPVIKRELRAADDRHRCRQALAKITEMEGKQRAIIAGSREAICYSQDGMHVDANGAYLAMFGYESVSDLEGVPVMNLLDKQEHATFKDFARNASKTSSPQSREFLAVKKDGARFHAEFTLSPVTVNGESCTQIVVTDVSKRKSVESKLQYLNQHDPLTGLYNRHYFIHELNKAMETARQSGITSGVIYVDLHQLKQINSTLGHAAGDRVLLKVVRLFRETLSKDVLLSRFSGDEFAILLHNADEAETNKTAASLINGLKSAAFTEGGQTFECQCAVGTIVVDKNTESVQKALSHVYRECERGAQDSAPSQAAATQGRAKVTEIRKPESAGDTDAAWGARIKDALSEGNFALAYQPVISLHGDPEEFFEVLLRMVEDGGNLIPPGQFMPAATRADLTVEIDRWVVRNAIDALGLLHQEGRQATFFVNLCPSAFKDVELISMVMQRLRAAGVKPRHLVFEADETAIVANPPGASTFINAAKTIGCRFSVDDFGRDPNAMKTLRELPVEFLKIDSSLIKNLSRDPVSQASLQAAVEVAKSLDKKTIAKAVEAADNLAVLWNLGVDYVQGNYFQQAEAYISYEFASETTLSSEVGAPGWTSNNLGR